MTPGYRHFVPGRAVDRRVLPALRPPDVGCPLRRARVPDARGRRRVLAMPAGCGARNAEPGTSGPAGVGCGRAQRELVLRHWARVECTGVTMKAAAAPNPPVIVDRLLAERPPATAPFCHLRSVGAGTARSHAGEYRSDCETGPNGVHPSPTSHVFVGPRRAGTGKRKPIQRGRSGGLPCEPPALFKTS